MRYSIIGGLLALLSVCIQPALSAEDCKPLQMLGSVDLDYQDGHVYANLLANGKPAKFLVSTAGGVTSLTPEGAAALGLKEIHDARVVLINDRSQSSESYVVIDDLSVGGAHIGHGQFMVLPPSESSNTDVVGYMGADILSHFDVEFDFAAGKMNLFSQDHCLGQVIYWKHVAVSMVPLSEFQPTSSESRTGYAGYLKRFEQMWVPVTLDDKSVPAQISTSPYSRIQSDIAQGAFGIDANSPGSERPANVMADPDTFEHTFSNLVFDGVTVTNPHFVIYPYNPAQYARRIRRTDTRLANLRDRSPAHIVIGMNILSKLHLFASFGERRLYITEASGPPKSATTKTSAPPPAPATRAP
ncbi:MAG: aspartyl protease family protein [Alphaproteobacteria bacterium]|nr:aspartyl protease family protein [Alphaproteobacteria bacterium]